MEPKDLKNSNEELNASQNSETDSVKKGNNMEEADQKIESPESETKKKKKPVKKETLTAASTPEKKEPKKKLPDKEAKAPAKKKVSKTAPKEEVKEGAETEEAEEALIEEVSVTEPLNKEELPEATIEKETEIIPEEKAAEKTDEDVTEEEVPSDSAEEEKKDDLTEEVVASDIKTEEDGPETKKEKKKKDTPPKEKDKESEESEKKQRIESYANLSEVELINALRSLLEKNDYNEIRDEVESIKSNFFKKFKAEIESQKKAFVEGGGKEDEFVAEEDPYELDLRNLLKQFQEMRIEFNKKIEGDKETNLQRKYEIIEEIKSLINNKESINKTFQEFRELQNQWREIGPVPQPKLKDLWDTYHHHVENFYDYIKINKELRDLDLKKNMELKIELCEKAEELLMESSIIKAFNTLQKYHDQWREIGPVPRDKKEELWERFKAATSQINKKHHEFFEKRKLEQKKNLEAKTALCEKAEEISILDMSDHKQWDEKSKELIELQKIWRTIGFAPKKDNNRIYDRFRSACDKFFDRKREFYSQNKELQQNNLQLKTDLCIQAEALKDSTDWKKTTDELISIQKRWKEIGPVPRKYSDSIWKRFRTACDYFFDNKSKQLSTADVEQVENLKLKKELIEEVKAFILSGNDSTDLDKLKEFQRRFTEIGYVPFKEKDNIQNEFRDAINIHFDSLQIDERRRNLLKFKNKVSNLSQSNRGQNRMYAEREKYISKLRQLEADLALLDNNVGFFANTKNAESLIDDINSKIEGTKEKIELLKEKIRIMDDMEDTK